MFTVATFVALAWCFAGLGVAFGLDYAMDAAGARSRGWNS